MARPSSWMRRTRSASSRSRRGSADFVFSCCYKWQLGRTGIAIGFWNRQLQPDWAPKVAGWMSARPLDGEGETAPPQFTPRDDAMRMTLGNPSLSGRLRGRQRPRVPPGRRHREDRGARPGVDRPPARRPRRAWPGGADAGRSRPPGRQHLHRPGGRRRASPSCLAERGVLVWEADGRVRYSAHLYNDSADVDRAIEASRHAADHPRRVTGMNPHSPSPCPGR